MSDAFFDAKNYHDRLHQLAYFLQEWKRPNYLYANLVETIKIQIVWIEHFVKDGKSDAYSVRWTIEELDIYSI